MAFKVTKQAQARPICSTANASEDTTLIGSATLNPAYREASLTDNQVDLQNLTNGVFVELRSQVDGDTGTFELWLYPDKGMAQFMGVYTYTTDEAVGDDGYFYADAFVQSVAGQHTVTILNMSDGVAVLKFDTLGCKYLVGLITAITSSDADGIAKLTARPW